MMGQLESGSSEEVEFNLAEDQMSVGKMLRKYRKPNENSKGPSENGSSKKSEEPSD